MSRAIKNALRIARRYADGGSALFDPTPMNPPKTPNQRVMEGHQEYEQGYGHVWGGRDRILLNSRGQYLQARTAADGGSIDEYSDVPGVGYVSNQPPDIPPAIGKVVGGLAQQFATLPKRALEASETMRQGGDYDPGPAMEAAGLMAGARFPFAKAGELGTFGGRLYSAAADAVNAAKFDKAQGGQWLGYLRNQPGVKAEELNWMGTPEFLQSQRGPVTKEQLAAHVREHQLELKDVEKGARTPPTEAEHQELAALERRVAERDQTLNNDDAGRLSELKMKRDQLPDAFSPTKFGSYTLPGGENYREMLLTMPSENQAANAYYREMLDKYGSDWTRTAPYEEIKRGQRFQTDTGRLPQDFKSSHFDEPNILAHVRFNDREIGGKKTLFVEEIQSDWHQQGKRKGYRGQDFSAETAALKKEYEAAQQEWIRASDHGTPDEARAAYAAMGEAQNRYGDIRFRADHSGEVPDAPFKTSWPELAMKRILKYAADGGYDQVAWTPGHVQAQRYDLSKQIQSVRFEKAGTSGFTPQREIDGLSDYGRLIATDHNGRKVIEQSVHQNELPNYIGKDVADKLLQADPKYSTTGGTARNIRELSGLDLSVGGEGMKGFYDQILPSVANKLTKKFGARVQQADLRTNQYKGYESFAAGEGPTGAPALYGIDRNGRWTVVRQNFANGAEAETEAASLNAGGNQQRVHVLPFTDALKRMAKEKGFPLFKRGGAVKGYSPPARAAANGGEVEPFEANYPEPEQVSDEQLAQAKINQQAAPREGGLMQTIPKAWEMMQTPEGRGKIGQAAAKVFGVHPDPLHVPEQALSIGTPAPEAKAPLQSMLVDPVVEMGKFPGKTYTEGTTPEEQTEWASNVSQTLMGAHLPFAKSGSAGVFGGKLSAAADKTMLAKAEEMETAGADRNKIWNDTGWGRDASGEWMYHHDVSNARLNEAIPEHPLYPSNVYIPEGKVLKLPNVLIDPKLYESYPFLKDWGVVGHDYFGQTNNRGMLLPKEKTIALSPLNKETMFDTLIHEVNHAIQAHEGFAGGGSYAQFLPKEYQQTAQHLQNQEKMLNAFLRRHRIPVKDAWDAMQKSVYTPESLTPRQESLVQKVIRGGTYDSLADFIQKTRNHYDLRQEAQRNYERLAGEIASRNAEFRARMTPEQSRQVTPWESQTQMRDPVQPGKEIVIPSRSTGPQMATGERSAPDIAEQLAGELISRHGSDANAIGEYLRFLAHRVDPVTIAKIEQHLEPHYMPGFMDEVRAARQNDPLAAIARAIEEHQSTPVRTAPQQGHQPRSDMSPEEAIQWLRENTVVRDPEHMWGYSNPQDYVDLARTINDIRNAHTPAEAIQINREGTARRDRVQTTPVSGRDYSTDLGPHPHLAELFGEPVNLEQVPYDPLQVARDHRSQMQQDLNAANRAWRNARGDAEARAARLALDHASRQYNKAQRAVSREVERQAEIRHTEEMFREAERESMTDIDPERYYGHGDISPEPPPHETVPPAAHPDFNRKFQEHLSQHYPDTKAFIKDYFGGYVRPENVSLEWRPQGVGYMKYETGFVLNAELYDKNGHNIGSTTRMFNPETKGAYNSYLRIQSGARGTGVVPTILGNQVALYRKLGIEKVEVGANIDVGGYAWAKYGFEPDKSHWDGLRQHFIRAIANNTLTLPETAGRSNYSPRQALSDILTNPDPKAMWLLADLDFIEQKTNKPIGNALLFNSSWHGTLHLNRAEAMKRFEDYVKKKKGKKNEPKT